MYVVHCTDTDLHASGHLVSSILFSELRYFRMGYLHWAPMQSPPSRSSITQATGQLLSPYDDLSIHENFLEISGYLPLVRLRWPLYRRILIQFYFQDLWYVTHGIPEPRVWDTQPFNESPSLLMLPYSLESYRQQRFTSYYWSVGVIFQSHHHGTFLKESSYEAGIW